MKKRQVSWTHSYTSRNVKRRIWKKIVRVMAGVVVFCTTYALILPAITMESASNCALEEHKHTAECYIKEAPAAFLCPYVTHSHTEECYAADGSTLCGVPEYVLHTHGEICYGPEGTLICTLPEIEPHVHGESCYAAAETVPAESEPAETVPTESGPAETVPAESIPAETVLVSEGHTHDEACFATERGALTCLLSEEEYHLHGDACYSIGTEPVCGLEEAEGHTHGEGCIQRTENLVCQISEREGHTHGEGCTQVVENRICQTEESEGHTHGEGCTDESGNLICQIPESEGHSHSESCIQVTETLVCQIPESEGHTHGEGCTEVTETLVCQTAESEGHSHTEDCFEKTLICTLEEKPQHLHTDECYELNTVPVCELEESEPVYVTVPTEETVPVEETAAAEETVPAETEAAEPVLVCAIEEEPRHDHSEACLETEKDLTCQLEEGEEHTHGEFCYGGWTLVCQLEEHTHGLVCKADPTADLETASDWEATFAHVELTDNWAQNVLLIAETQLGYTESERNYAVWPDNTVHGYTRYGEWYGMPHADWCGMFVSFCMHYAGVEEVPVNYGVRPWVEELSSDAYDLFRPAEEYTPKPGDIVFFDWEDDGNSDHVGIVYELIEATEEEPARVKTIEGNSGDRVQYVTYELEDTCLLGYCDMAAAQERYRLRHLVTQTAQTENYIVTVTYSDQLALPEGAQLQVTEYAKDSDIFRQRCEEAGYELDWLLNIGFFLDGEELELDGEFDVVVTSKQGDSLGSDITHFANDGTERIDGTDVTDEAEEGQSAVSFSADSFSDYGGGAAAVAETGTNELLINFGDGTDTVEYNITKNEGFGEGNKAVVENGFLAGNIVASGTPFIRFKLTSDSSYTIAEGDIASVCIKATGGTDLGHIFVAVKNTNGVEKNDTFSVNTNGEYVTYTLDLSTLVGYGLDFFDVKWNGATAGAVGTFSIDYVRIGQPQEHTHSYEYTVTKGTGCNAYGTVTYTCACGDTNTVEAATVAGTVRDYAENLRAANDEKTDYSVGGFTWDQEGKNFSWTYYNGVMMDAFMRVGSQEMLDYVIDFYDDNLQADGTPVTWHEDQVDSVPMALALFDLLGTNDETQNQRYVTAIQYVFNELWNNQENLGADYGYNFRHKENNANWVDYPFALDGIYMALPFLVEYANALDAEVLTNSTVTSAEIYQTVTARLEWVADTMYDSNMQLYHHGWNSTNGGNGVFWGRGIGWYAVALVDIIDMMPETYSSQLTDNLTKLFNGMLEWQDAETGMWYNLVNYDDTLKDDSGTLLDNRLETSVSSMMAYAMMKAYNKGFVSDDKYYEAGLRALNGIIENKLTDDGTIIDTYKSSGVGTTPAAYFTNGYVTNEAKGVGALILAAAPDHVWGEWKISEAAAAASTTTTVQTVETRTCAVCNAQQTRTITAEEAAKTLVGYKFETVDPTQLVEGETYVIYCRPDSSDVDTYTFMFSDSQSLDAHTVKDTTHNNYPVNISNGGETWTLTTGQMGTTDINSFTWGVEKDTANNIVKLSLQGYDNKDYEGPEYLAMRGADYLTTWNGTGTEYIDLTVSAVTDGEGTAACVLTNNKHSVDLLYNSSTTEWTTVATGSGTNVYFAKVTPVYEEETEPEEETYTFQVLGTTGPEVGKKYVIYYPYTGANTGTNDVKILSSALNGTKGNFSRGINNVASSLTDLKQTGSTWSLTESQVTGTGDGVTVDQLQWTVVQVGDDLCLQSVADPTLYLKLVCTNTSGASQVNSTAYDAQGPQYFALNFESSGVPDDSWYYVTSEDQLAFNEQNIWQAVDLENKPENYDALIKEIYFAQVVGDSTEDDSGTTETVTEERFVGYDFVTLDPTTLYEGQIVSIYVQPDDNDTDTYTFVNATKNIPADTVLDTGLESQPTTVDGKWSLSTAQLGDSIEAISWIVHEKDDKTIWLEAMGYVNPNPESGADPKEYLAFKDGGVQTYNGNNGQKYITLRVNGTDEAGCTLQNVEDSTLLYYDAANQKWVSGATGSTVYFASVSPKNVNVSEGVRYPDAVRTGEPSVDTLRFYNFAAEKGSEHISALAGCTFVIKGETNGYTYTIISGDNPELHLPADIPDGEYTIEEISVPEGYLRDVNPKRSFTISGGKFAEVDGKTLNIGTFLNYNEGLSGADKVAQVEDYNNRTYQIMLSANSDLRLYEMNPVDVIFVVDQSNSMLFPAGLVDTQKKVTLSQNLGKNLVTGPSAENAKALEDLGLDKNTVYYIIADENVSSTVYAVWHNGVDWMFQDASYYAKAKYENAPGYRQEGEYAAFPVVASNTEQPSTATVKYIESYDVDGVPQYVEVTDATVKSNGGSLSYEISNCSLATDIAAGEEFTIYTASNEYNRLHYLQDALAHAIYQLADANPLNTVSLIRFTRVTDHGQCMGPLALTPENVEELVNAVGSITTSGGTRQDIALEHAYAHLINTQTTYNSETEELVETQLYDTNPYNKGEDYTFVVLITDGAPARSGSDTLNLGNPNDETPSEDQILAAKKVTNANTNQENGVTVYNSIKYYGGKVDEKSILMTIGLGMDRVLGGKQVLKEIASEPTSAYHMMLENSEGLMYALKQLLFSSMMPREKIDLMGDITDVISDSFYPIAYTAKGSGASTGRQVLYSDDSYDWILLNAGDWITLEGQYVGPDKGSTGAGQLTQDTNGDFRITWSDQVLYDCGLVWVPTLVEVPSGREVVLAEDNLGTLTDADGNTTNVGRYWFYLELGEYVYAHGEYAGSDLTNIKTGTVGYSFLANPDREYEVTGQYLQGENDLRPHIQWEVQEGKTYYDIDFDASFQPYLWSGKFYVKAKEDFIGGNAIDTNKLAEVALQENDGDNVDETIGTISLETPTVNVHLLDMNELSSEVTVFLGDMINSADSDDPLASPLDSLKDFFEKTYFEKLHADIDGKAAVMNKVQTADGLESDKFYLKYAMGGLTDDQWAKLAAGESVAVEYTYDNASSHGPVGYFTFKLGMGGREGTTPSYEAHESTVACQPGGTPTTAECTTPSEYYHLFVTYTAYELNEASISDSAVTRPEENVHNGSLGPGTEVTDDEEEATLAEGYGIVSKNNVHEVHVISGEIKVTKEITSNLVSTSDQTYTFTVLRMEDNWSTEVEVIVKAEETSGTATLSNLPRGTYVLSEKPDEAYHVESLVINTATTNCYSTAVAADSAKNATFHIGYDTTDTDVIGYADGKQYTSYTGTPNGVFGEALVTNTKSVYEGKVPVRKVWLDSKENNAAPVDTVYVILTQQMGNGERENVTSGDSVKLLALSEDSGWSGEFTVSLLDSDDTVASHNYGVTEVERVITEEAYNALEDAKKALWTKAALEGTSTILYYRLSDSTGNINVFEDRGYVVSYSTETDASSKTTVTHVVTNARAYELPEAGGMGAQWFTVSGGLLMAAALTIFCSRKRKRESRADA